MEFIIIYITHPDENTAKKISDHLVEKKYVACANIFPITSSFWWQSNIEKEHEWVSIVKTIPAHWDSVQKEVENIHPYDVPCIMKIPVSANTAYAKWIQESVLPPQ